MGSPPQVRGKRLDGLASAPTAGITPAGAGKTSRRACKRTDGRDHPRRCGENRTVFKYLFTATGSPPQVRGKLRFTRASCIGGRITPAGAGKTRNSDSFWINLWDHPRRCGENDVRLRKFDPVPGSPPQVRGKLSFSRSLLGVTRITPAGAGKTILCRRVTVGYEDHPRRCGENCRALLCFTLRHGSPPQVRGKH